LSVKPAALPETFRVEIAFKEPARARRAAFYPGMEALDPSTVVFQTGDYLEVMRMFLFVL
jgi:D-amino peptidase